MGMLRWLLVLAVVAAVGAVLWQWTNSVDVEEFYRDKRVILTGASRGIGRGLALRLAQLGAKLVIGARSAEQLSETRRECLTHTPSVSMVIGDVSEEGVCRQLVETAVELYGGVDIVIINAAMTPSPPEDFVEMSNPAEALQRYFRVNVLQAVYLTQFAMPYLNASQGIIVPVSSATGQLAIPKVSLYSTTKHALQGFFKALNQELVLSGSKVSITIMPLPYVLTDKAIEQWKPLGGHTIAYFFLSVEDCVERMIRGIPRRQLWYYIDWAGYTILHLYSLIPTVFDHLVLTYLPFMSELFS